MIAQTLLNERAMRERIFGKLAEPQWLMLLDLWAAPAPLPVSTLCYGCFAPPTTGLRHLDRLAQRGFVARHDHPADRRQVLVSLTADARDCLVRFANATQERRLAA
jgi:DNA-binding MarR family transcriptional regulator